MSVNYANLFSALGKYVGLLNALRDVATTTIPARLSDLEAQFTILAGDYDRLLSGMQTQAAGFSDSEIIMCNALLARCEALLTDREVVLNELRIQQSPGVNAVLVELARDMVLNSQRLLKSTVTVGTVTAVGTPAGTGQVFVSKVLDGVSAPMTGAIPLRELLGVDSELCVDAETMWAECTGEGDGSETFKLGGSQSSNGGFDWREGGSGGPLVVQVANAATIVQGKDFNSFVSDTPVGWVVSGGIAGTHIFEQTAGANVFRGTSSLRIRGDGTQNPIRIDQPLAAGVVTPGRGYILSAAVKGVAATTGTLLIQLRGTGYTPGTLEKISINLATVSTSWGLQTCFLNLPFHLPSDLYIEVKVTGPMTNGKDVWVDSLAFKPVSWFGGLGVEIVDGAVPFNVGDRWQWSVANNNAGAFGTFFRRGYKLQLPSGATASADLADTKVTSTVVVPPPVPVVPQDLAGLVLWSDPADPGTLTLRKGASFPGGGSTNYLKCDNHVDFNFNVAGSFTVILSRNMTVNPLAAGDPGAAQTFISHGIDAANSGGWAVKAPGASGKEPSFGLFVATNTGGTTFADKFTDTASNLGPQCSRLAAVFSGGTVTLYQDGQPYGGSYVTTGSMPAAPFWPGLLVPLTIGREGHSLYQDCLDILFDVRLFGRALNASEILQEYNNGVTEPYTALSSGLKGQLVADWPLNGSLVDASGRGHTLTVVGSVPFVDLVVHESDKGSLGLESYPCTRTNFNLLGDGFAPRYNPTGINGLPTFDFSFNQYLYASESQPYDTATLSTLEVLRLNAIPAAEFFTTNSADESTELYYFMTGFSPVDLGSGVKLYPTLRVKNDTVGVLDNHVYAKIEILANTNYLICWRMLGAGDAASVVCEVNGVQAVLTYGSADVYNAGPQDVNFRDNVSVNSLARTGAGGPVVTVFGTNYRLGERLYCAPGLNDADYLAAKQYMAAKWGITLP